MAHIIADRIRDTSTTEGTGSWTVSGTAPLRYETFSTVVTANGDTFPYCIVHQTADEWEVGLATRTAANAFTRTTVFASSTGGTAVPFTAGTKDTMLVFPANPAMANALALGHPTDTVLTREAAGIVQVGTNRLFSEADLASSDQYILNTTGKILGTDGVNASGALQGLTVGGSTIPWDMTADGWNVSFTLSAGALRTLENPTNPIVGRTGMIVITHSAANNSLGYGTNWEAAGGVGTLPAISIANGAKDIIFYIVQSTTSIVVTGILKAVA